MKAAVYTLGCKLNQCESEALASSFDSRGFFIGRVSEDADIYIINTCTVTSKAEQKARRVIRKLASEHPHSAVLVTGCYAQLDGAELALGGNVVVVPHDFKDDISRLPEFLVSYESGSAAAFAHTADRVRSYFDSLSVSSEAGKAVLRNDSADPDRFWYDSVDFNYHSRAFLKIQDGCDNSCAYCRVTIARGASVSLDSETVVEQFKALQAKGYREVVLTGVNLTSYSSNGIDFADLLVKLTSAAKASPDPARIRISSIEPETIDRRLADAVSSPLVCPHFHISVQSGSNGILEAMRRRNSREKIIEGVELLRSVKEDPFFAADVIAGFPGETDADFELTRSLLDECDFTFLHVFPFSPRPGTAAADMPNQVPERIAGERTSVLRKLSARKSAAYAERWKGREIDVLLEQQDGAVRSGTSGNYLKCEVCDIINSESGQSRTSGLCRAIVDSAVSGSVRCSFRQWI